MNSLARKIASLFGLVLLIGIIFVLASCQESPSPQISNDSLTPPIAAPIPSLAFAPGLTPIAIPTLEKLSTPVPSRIPSLAFAPAYTRLPTDAPDLVDGHRGVKPIQAPATQPIVVIPPTAKATAAPMAMRLFKDSDLYIHLPPQAEQRQPLRVLFVLHGMGARGDTFAQSLVPDADRNNWIVVAPSMNYQDYMQTTSLMDDDLKISQMLLDTLDLLPARLNLKLDRHVLVYGFSRGAQLAHRFALLHPERVATVATISAGSYTLPLEHSKDDNINPLPFPFGVGDFVKQLGHPLDVASFKQVSFWIAVGERDNQPGDVPRSFDPYVGSNRVERARSFANCLTSQGIDARLVIFPNTGHEVTAEMRKGALQFLREDELKDNPN